MHSAAKRSLRLAQSIRWEQSPAGPACAPADPMRSCDRTHFHCGIRCRKTRFESPSRAAGREPRRSPRGRPGAVRPARQPRLDCQPRYQSQPVASPGRCQAPSNSFWPRLKYPHRIHAASRSRLLPESSSWEPQGRAALRGIFHCAQSSSEWAERLAERWPAPGPFPTGRRLPQWHPQADDDRENVSAVWR